MSSYTICLYTIIIINKGKNSSLKWMEAQADSNRKNVSDEYQ